MSSIFYEALGVAGAPEGSRFEIGNTGYVMRESMLRQEAVYSPDQAQTSSAFGYQWSRQDLVLTPESIGFFRENLATCFPDYRRILEERLGSGARVLDAGCGSGAQSHLFFEGWFDRIHYLGVDISSAVDFARRNFADRALAGEFIQADLSRLPFTRPTFDFIWSCGVLHHTPSVARGVSALADLLLPGGTLMAAVYRRPPPIRAHVDQLVRHALAELDDAQAFEALMPLTRLGIALGDLDVSIDVPEAIPYLGIEKGSYTLQRFMHFFIMKAFYRADMSPERINLHNFDWYRPLYNFTHTADELGRFCTDAGLTVDWVKDTSPGNVTLLATKPKRDGTHQPTGRH